MYSTDYSCYVLRKKDAGQFVFASVIGVVFMVSWLVFVYGKMAHKLSKGMKDMDFFCLIGMLIFIALALAIYFTKRFRVNVTGANDKLKLEIKDRTMPRPLVIESPFSLRRQWHTQPTGKLEMKILYVTVMDPQGTPLVTFSSALGAAYNAPPGFEFINMFNPEERAQLSVAPLVYETGKTLKIEEEIRIYLNFMANRAKKMQA
ncbi:MAG: hypothetical protein K0S33_3623 [Bacteroidetes bacterium]|nr:hypothetical protein [Bacteroidota bacterium]